MPDVEAKAERFLPRQCMKSVFLSEVFSEQVCSEVVVEVAPDAVWVIGSVLNVDPFHDERRPLRTVVVLDGSFHRGAVGPQLRQH